jgi:hypothetical protein
MRRPKHRYQEPATREEIEEILADSSPPPWSPSPASPQIAPVPMRLHSAYYWNPFSLLCGLHDVALPQLSPPAWKIVSTIGIRQLAAATLGRDAPHRPSPIALSISDLMIATGLSRVAVIAAIRKTIDSGWLSQEKRRTPHGGNAVALYSIDWQRAERAERTRRKRSASGGSI